MPLLFKKRSNNLFLRLVFVVVFLLVIFGYSHQNSVPVKAVADRLNIVPGRFNVEQTDQSYIWKNIENSFLQDLSPASELENYNQDNSANIIHEGAEIATTSATSSAPLNLGEETTPDTNTPTTTPSVSTSTESNTGDQSVSQPEESPVIQAPESGPTDEPKQDAPSTDENIQTPVETTPAPSNQDNGSENSGDTSYLNKLKIAVNKTIKDIFKNQSARAQDDSATTTPTENKINQQLTFSDFNVPMGPTSNQIGSVRLMYSIAGKSNLTHDKVLFEYNLDGNWEKLGEMEVNKLGQPREDYINFAIPNITDWAQINRLKTRVSYIYDGDSRPADEKLEIYLDAIWLAIDFNKPKQEIQTSKDYELTDLFEKKDYKYKDALKFRFQYKRTNRSVLSEIGHSILGLFVDEYKDLNISAKIFKAGAKDSEFLNPEVKYLKNGEFEIEQPNLEREFKPGKYSLEVEIKDSENIYTENKEFTWGVLALNTNKSSYLPGEKSYLQMAVLNDLGHTICNADLRLEISNPDGVNKVFSTDDGSLVRNKACGPDNVIDSPDYYAYYQTDQAGTYMVKLTASTDKGIEEITDVFEVKDELPFEVERIGPTRIYPRATYGMDFKIKANQDYQGEFKEFTPSSFTIMSADGADINKNGDTNEIVWNVNWEKGKIYHLRYTFDAPDNSPDFYLLGPAQIGDFIESRSWQIAADAPIQTVTAERIAIDSGSADIVNWTTAVSAYSTSFVPGKQYFVYVSSGFTNSTVNQSVDFEIRYGSDIKYTGLVEPNGDANDAFQISWMDVFTEPATTTDITLYYRPNANTARMLNAQIIAINLDDLTTNDWKYASNTTTVAHGTSMTARSTTTLDKADGVKDWLVFGMEEVAVDNTAVRYEGEIYNGASSYMQYSMLGKRNTELLPYVLFRPFNAVATNTQFSLRSRDSAANAAQNDHVGSKIFAINLNAFENHKTTYVSGASAIGASWTALANLNAGGNYQPTYTGDQVIFSSFINTITNASAGFNTRLQVSSTTMPNSWSWAQAPAVSVTNHSNADREVSNIADIFSMNTAGGQIELDAMRTSGANQSRTEAAMAIFSTEKWNALTISADNQYKSDATTTIANGDWTDQSAVKLKASSNTKVNSPSIKFYFEFLSDSGTFTTATSEPSSACPTGTAFNDCFSKVWLVTATTTSNSASGTVSITGLPETDTYKWQVKAFDNNNYTSDWREFNTDTPNIKVDLSAPTTPGALSGSVITGNNVTLNFGSQSSDVHFDKYRIFYHTGTSTVTESDTEQVDDNLNYINYNGQAKTLVIDLLSNTTYSFNIWAYDLAGKKSSSTQLSITTKNTISATAYRQYKSDIFTSISNQGWTNENQVYLSGLANTVSSTTNRFDYYFELKDETGSFTTSTSTPPSPCSSGTDYGSCTGKIWKTSANTTSWYNVNWKYRKKITINYSKVKESINNFVILATTTAPELAYPTYGGNMGSSTGADMVVTDSGGTTTLSYQREYYASSTGQIALWIKANISSTTNTTLYLYYGNNGNITDQSTTTGPWSNQYKIVQHLNNDPGPGVAGDIKDSSVNANNATAEASMLSTDSVNGYIGQAIHFDGNGDYLSIPDSVSVDSTTGAGQPRTWEYWVNFNAITENKLVTDKGEFAGSGLWSELHTGSRNLRGGVIGAGQLVLNSTFTQNNWYNIVWVYDGANTKVYINGQLDNQGAQTAPADNANAFNIMGCATQPTYTTNGVMDELRVLNTALSTTTIQTEYNNQSSVSSFLNFSDEESISLMNYESAVQISNIPDRGGATSTSGYKWQVFVCSNDGTCSNWDKFNSSLPNFKTDTQPPTAPGDLTYSTSTPTTITLNLGSSTVESNFSTYKIFYKSGISGVNVTDTEHSDANLGYIDYNNAIDTTISGLEAGTQYVMDIWAYDLAGNKTPATELVQNTLSAPHARARSVMFQAGVYSGNGSTGQNSDTNQKFSVFNFKLPETDVTIRNAYIVFESQFESYNSNSGDYTGYNLSFDTCEEPCTAEAFGANAITVDDNSILAYNETAGNQIRLLYDVTDQTQLKNYIGNSANMQAQVGYRLEAGTAAASIANAKATLVITYSYNHDSSDYYANTVVYPLESTNYGDSGTRRAGQTNNCTKNNNCPLFNYKVEIPEINTSLSRWFQMYTTNAGNGNNDINVNVNIQGREVDSDTYIHESANGNDQGDLPAMIFNNVQGFSENSSGNQSLEFYAGSSGTSTSYLIGGEVYDTYFASKSAAVKTRTVAFPIGIISNGQNVSTASGTVQVYFPENGVGTGNVTIKKAWFRVIGNYYNNVYNAWPLTVSSQIGSDAQSANYIYQITPGTDVIKPSFNVIHIIPSSSYATLASANATTPKAVTIYTTNGSTDLGGVSAELMITYTYSDESNGYLSSLDLYAGQSPDNANAQSTNSTVAKTVFPELRGTKTIRAASLLSNYLITESSGNVPGAWFTFGSNIAISGPVCTNDYGHRTDSLNSFGEYYRNIISSIVNTTDKIQYSACYSNYNSIDPLAGAKMSGSLHYVYQWDAPPSEFTQDKWRWYNNIDAVEPTTSKGNENTAVTGINIGDAIRLRINVIVSKVELATSSQQFKLQYGQGSTCSNIISWSDVGSIGDNSPWIGYNNPTPADGVNINSLLLSSSTVKETYEESNSSLANPRSVLTGQWAEWDWAIYNNSATSSSDYCFRMIKNDNNPLNDYLINSYPKVTTAASNTPPNVAYNLGQYRSNGTTTIPNLSWTNEQFTATTSVVKLAAAATDPNISELPTLYFELIPNVNSFTTATSQPSGACTSGTSYTACTNKIWYVAPGSAGDYRTNPFIGTTTVNGIPNSATGYKWQVLACDDSGACSNWTQFASGPNFRVDVANPTAPGALVVNKVNALSVILQFGATTTEANFYRYRVFYKVGTSTVLESDSEQSDSNLLDINYNGKSTTTVLNLSAGTRYSFKIWAYDLAGNKASSTQISTTTLSSYGKPTGSILSLGEKTDGSGSVDFAINANDPDNDNTLRAKIQYEAGSGCAFASPGKATIDTTDANTIANLGADPKIDNGYAYQVGTTTGYIWTSLGQNTVFFDWLSKADLNNIEGIYCVRTTLNDNTVAGDQATPTTQTLYIDNKAPTTPGYLSVGAKNYTSINLHFGTSSSDVNFSEYKIFYKPGYTGVTESDGQWDKTNDSHLGNANFYGATSTTINNLTPNTQYVFSIWAYDAYGNKASSTELTVKTNARPINISADNQYRSNGTTTIANGTLLDDNTVVLKASVHDQDVGDLETFYFQLIAATSTYLTATSTPTSSCSTGTAYNSCSSKVWAISTTTSVAPTDWYDPNWLYRKKIIINSSQVISNENGFPILATTTDSNLAQNARSDGYDILFTSANGTTTIPYQREYYNSTTGELVSWIKTNISSTTNTEIYMYYGNSGAITDNATTTGVWDSNFSGVWHLQEDVVDQGTQANAHLDSTVFANYGNQYGNNEILAKFYKGQDFDGINDYIGFNNSNSLNPTNALTMEFWSNGNLTNPPANQSVAYSLAGNSTFYVPAGVTSITVKVWGGGGGGGAGADGGSDQTRNTGGNGGGAGYTLTTLSVIPGEALTILVGGGGGSGTVRGGGTCGDGGGGGGRSEVVRNSTQLAVAAGGGGGGGATNYTYSSGSNGGPGGGTIGAAGGNSGTVTGGRGATQSVGGSGGVGTNNGSSGDISTGGAGADGRNAQGNDGSGPSGGTGNGGNGGQANITAGYPGGGGGGAGYYGGGGGAENANNGTDAGAGAGGGVCYTSGTGTSTTAGSGKNAGNNSDSDYANNAGAGGAGGNYGAAGVAGNVGRVVIIYTPAITLAGKGNAYQINLNNSSVLSGLIGSTSVSTTYSAAGWHYTALTYDRSAGGTDQVRLYFDGDIKSTANYTSTIATNTSSLKLGEIFDGAVDEFRLSSSARSLGWVKSSYRNQTSVGSFLSVGNETTLTSYYNNIMMIAIPDANTGYKWQVMVCDDDGDCSGWGKFNVNTPNFKVDTQAPTAPGALTESSKTSNSVTLAYGTQSSDSNFSRYRIYYSTVNPVTEADTEHEDSNLTSINYNGASLTTILGLNSNTTYYFNIWAYDAVNHKATSSQISVTTNAASSSPGVVFYTKGNRQLYYKVWKNTAWSAEKVGPILSSAVGDNIRQIRSVRSDDGGKVGLLVKSWDGTNQRWWGAVYRFSADDFVSTSSLGSAQANATNNQLMTGCLAALSGGEFFIIRNNNASNGTVVYSWNSTSGWVNKGAGQGPSAVVNGCNLVRRPGTDNYLLLTFDDNANVGTSYYYGGSTYNNSSWTAWTSQSTAENDTDNFVGDAYFDSSNNTRGAINFTGSASASYTQAKYFTCSNSSINFGAASNSPATWSGNFVHGEFAADPGNDGIAYYAGRDTNDELNVYQVSIASGTTPAWSIPGNSDNLSTSQLYTKANSSQKPFAIDFYKNGKGVVAWNFNFVFAPQYSVITTAGNTLDATPTILPGTGADLWSRVRFYDDPNESEFLALYQNDNIDYGAVFWDGSNNRFYNTTNNPGSKQVFTKIATTTGAISKDDEDTTFAYTGYNSTPYTPTSLMQLKKDATTTIANGGWTNENEIRLKALAKDPDTYETLTLYIQFLANADTFTTSTTQPGSACPWGTAFGGCSSKIWFVASSTPGDYSANPFAGILSITSIPDSSSGYKWQAIVCDSSGACSDWVPYNSTQPNIKVDIVPPSAPGALTIASKTSYSVTLNYGATTTESNFYKYRIFYSTTTPVTVLKTEQVDTNLNYISFNGASSTIVLNLASTTTYYFNIWAYDLAGNVATSTTEVSTTTNASPSLRQVSYRFEDDDGADVNTNTAAAAADTPLSNLVRGERVIARLQIDNAGGDTATNEVYKLQFENQTDLPGVWVDVGSATQTSYALGLSGSTGNAITGAKATYNSKTWVNGLWQENINTTGNYSLTNGYYTEFGFVISTGLALPGKTYRLRLYNNTDNTALNVYSSYPTFSIATTSNKIYSKDTVASLATDYSALSYHLDPLGYSNVASDDNNRDYATSSSNIPVVQFAISTTTNTYSPTATWNGQSSVAASTRKISLQIYHFGTTNAWVTVASNTSATANTDFNLSGSINAKLSEYFDVSYRTYWRVYQDSGTETLRTDYFDVSYSAPTPLVQEYHYRWRNNNGGESTSTWREAWDTADPTVGTNLSRNTNVRLRFVVANIGAGTSTNYAYQLQYAYTTTGCATDPGGWTSVPVSAATEHFNISTSTYFVNGALTTATSSNSEGYAFISGRMVKNPSATTSAITLAENNYTEVEYVFLANNNSTLGGTYCFRVANNSIALDSYTKYAEITLVGNTNTAPAFTISPSDSNSATSSPTNYGNNVTFSATAQDTQGDNYYLAVCKTNSVTAGNDASPTCNGGNWCISSAASSTVSTNCSYATATTSESLPWYAFVCDKVAGASIAKCSAASQGNTGTANDSPFVVNHAPVFSLISTTDNNKNPGDTFRISATTSDIDVLGGQDAIKLFVCLSNGAGPAGCNLGVSDTVCSVTGTTSPNSYCTFSKSIPTAAGTTGYFAFLFDEHNMPASANYKFNAYTVNNVPTVANALVLNSNAAITLNMKGAADKQIQTIMTNLSDDNGCATIVGATAVIYMSNATNGYNCTANNNDCYQITTGNCVMSGCSGTTANFTCTTNLKYYAIPTDGSTNNPYASYNWLSRILINDGANLVATTSAGVELNTSQALDVSETVIDFGSSLQPGQNTGSINQPSTIINSGNCPINSGLSGTDMLGNPTGTITVDNLKYSLTSGFNYLSQGTQLSISENVIDIDAARPTSTDVSDIVYWGIGVPGGSAKSAYGGQNYFSSYLDSLNWN